MRGIGRKRERDMGGCRGMAGLLSGSKMEPWLAKKEVDITPVTT